MTPKPFYVYSSKSDASIGGFGWGHDTSTGSIKNFERYDMQDILESLGESFYENYYDFEDGVRQAKKLSDNGMDYTAALHEVFGKFEIYYKCSIPELKLDIELDNDALNMEMYHNVSGIWV